MGITPPDALLVFAKPPVPGQVKTRLVPPLSEDEAAAFYRAVLFDALDQYTQLPVTVRLYVAPGSTEFPENEVPSGVTLHTQRGDGLGDRMRNAFLETFAAGFSRIVVIGTDHPTLPLFFVEQAFEALRAPMQVVIGPTEDGGYYLLGKNEFYPHLFLDRYSHDQVFEETLARAATTRAGLTLLPTWYDVDDPPSLQRLIADLPDATPQARRTAETLTHLRAHHPELG